MPPRSLWEWYKAVATGWIQEEDMMESLRRHALGWAVDRETLRRGLKSRTLEGRELEEFARVAVESGHAAIRWLEKTRRSFKEAIYDLFRIRRREQPAIERQKIHSIPPCRYEK